MTNTLFLAILFKRLAITKYPQMAGKKSQAGKRKEQGIKESFINLPPTRIIM